LEKIGVRLRAVRLLRNLSQKYVAGIVGISVPAYRKLEQGDRTVEFRHVARALGALGEVIPATEPELRLNNLLRPQGKHASKPRRKGWVEKQLKVLWWDGSTIGHLVRRGTLYFAKESEVANLITREVKRHLQKMRQEVLGDGSQ